MPVMSRSLRLGITTIAAVALGGTAVFLSALASARARATQLSEIQILTPPSTTVPLTYRLQTVLEHGGTYVQNFNMYQASDGSLRRETIEPDGSIGYIDIVNLSLNKYFERVRGQWTEYTARPGANVPPKLLLNDAVRQIPATDPRVAGLADLGVPLTFYERRGATDNTGVIFCPELNMLRVWQGYGGGTHQFIVRWAELGEPDVQFVPPDHATVRIDGRPRGPGRVTAADLADMGVSHPIP